MNKSVEPIFSVRPTVVLELPLDKNARILHPEQVILKVESLFFDVGAFCYTLRSPDQRKPGQPGGVVLDSFLKRRPAQIRQVINALSRFVTDGGKRIATVKAYAARFKWFMDWADTNGLHDCLDGGESTRQAYVGWVEDTNERYHRQELGKSTYNQRLQFVREILEAAMGLENIRRGTGKAKRRWNPNSGTEPLAPHDFAHAVALNQALFDGLCDLVLGNRPFPYKLVLPASLGWTENHLWVFPTQQWHLAPHQWGSKRETRANACWAYDYAAGRLAAPDEIAHRYALGRPSSEKRNVARKAIVKAQSLINAANSNPRDRVRTMLGMVAHNAFLFLFFCNTGNNESVARDIETDGKIDVFTLNQKYRSIKFRAGGKSVTEVVPAPFMPTMRRFMELRRYLLNDRAFPHLFFTLGNNNAAQPSQIGLGPLDSLYRTLLRDLDPQLPSMRARRLRASVADWYQRHHDASVTAKVLQNSEQTTLRHYDAGSTTDHREELSLFLTSVSESAKRQRVLPATVADAIPLEDGGSCDGFGHPEALADRVPVKPNCKDSQGCLFCAHRVLIACEEDTRKIASAAFVMEQVILGPKHEEAMLPLIAKCNEDMEKIAAFGTCRPMVERVRKDVFENGNLTAFFADKYQLFLELGVIA